MKLLDGEYFKDIPGTGGHMQASNMGRFKRGNKFMPTHLNRDGYLTIYINEFGKRILAHRVIAAMYCECKDPDNQNVVDHINNIKTDNRAENLRWATVQENTQYYSEFLAETGEKRRYVTGYVLAVNKENEGQLYVSIAQALEDLSEYNISMQDVCGVLAGKKKTAKGFRFYRITNINDSITRVDGATRSGVNQTFGRWADTTFDHFYVKIADHCPYDHRRGEEPRSSQAEMLRDLEKIKEMILQTLPSSKKYHAPEGKKTVYEKL